MYLINEVLSIPFTAIVSGILCGEICICEIGVGMLMSDGLPHIAFACSVNHGQPIHSSGGMSSGSSLAQVTYTDTAMHQSKATLHGTTNLHICVFVYCAVSEVF